MKAERYARPEGGTDAVQPLADGYGRGSDEAGADAAFQEWQAARRQGIARRDLAERIVAEIENGWWSLPRGEIVDRVADLLAAEAEGER